MGETTVDRNLKLGASNAELVIQNPPDTWKLHKVHSKRISKGISGNARKKETVGILISWKMAGVKA